MNFFILEKKIKLIAGLVTNILSFLVVFRVKIIKTICSFEIISRMLCSPSSICRGNACRGCIYVHQYTHM